MNAPVISGRLAPNPGPLTLDGTNTWVVGGVVIDPGPLDEGHLAAVAELAGGADEGGAVVETILLTHGHADHSAGVARLADLVGGCPIRAADPAYCAGASPLVDGDVVGGLRVVAVPGHTSDSMAFLEPAAGVLFSGDTVLGRGTSFVAHPDGRLGPYLASLRRLRRLASTGAVTAILPGHGPRIDDPIGVLDFYLEHRAERLEQVRAAVEAGAATAREVVEQVYADVDRVLWPAAERSVEAQLVYLAEEPGAHRPT